MELLDSYVYLDTLRADNDHKVMYEQYMLRDGSIIDIVVDPKWDEGIVCALTCRIPESDPFISRVLTNKSYSRIQTCCRFAGHEGPCISSGSHHNLILIFDPIDMI